MKSIERKATSYITWGEVVAEACQGYRNAVAQGKMTADEALEISNAVIRSCSIIAELKIPMEEGSTQLPELIPSEYERIQAARKAEAKNTAV